jgi:NOL1/NOP2/fmu family ribosome biogenesis protein
LPSYADLSEEVRRMLGEFGVEEIPGRLVFRHEAFWLTTAPEIPEKVRVHAVGVRLARVQPHGLKPTSFGLMVLGELVRKRRVEVSREELRELLLGRALRKPGLPEGYVALCLDGEVLGCGEVRGEFLRCQIPLGRRQELLVALAHENKLVL